ncbi:MAG: radical SAM protein [Planctomycetota bacterium]|nr:radical SAM protein [Planctomycetota bacterium]
MNYLRSQGQILWYRMLYDERYCAIIRVASFSIIFLVASISAYAVSSLSFPEKIATALGIASGPLIFTDVLRAIFHPARTMSSKSGEANFKQFLSEALNTLSLAEREFRFVTLLSNPGPFVMKDTYRKRHLDEDFGFIQAMTNQIKQKKKQLWIHQVYPPNDEVLKVLKDICESPDTEPADVADISRGLNKAIYHLTEESNLHNITIDKFILSQAKNIIFAMAIADDKVAVIGLLDRTKSNPLESMHAGFIVANREQVNQWKEIFDQLYRKPSEDFHWFLQHQVSLAASIGYEAAKGGLKKHKSRVEQLIYQKLYLVSPSVPKRYREVSRTGCYPPLTLLTLAAYVNEHLPQQVKIKIINGQTMTVDDVISKIEPGSLVGISCHILDYENAVQIAQRLHARDGENTKIVFGGPYPSAGTLAKLILAHQPTVDYVVRGDGEQPLIDILKGTKPQEIPNLVYRANGSKVAYSSRRFALELDKQPLLSKEILELIDMNYYFSNFQQKYTNHPKVKRPAKRGFAISSQRGCPFKEQKGPCLFCSTPYRNWRSRPPKHVWDEISMVAKDPDLQVDFIWDVSESFTGDMDYLQDFVNKRPRGLDLDFLVYSRTSDLSDEVVRLLAEMGCYQVVVGFESGDNDILNKAKKETTVEQGHAAAMRLKQYGIKLFAAFVLGIEGETEESAEKTLVFADKIANLGILEEVSCSILMPIPGSLAFEDKPDLVAKYAKSDLLNILELKQEYVRRYCNVSYEKLESIRDKILKLGAVNSCFAEPVG